MEVNLLVCQLPISQAWPEAASIDSQKRDKLLNFRGNGILA
jgi:hypothetical protein